MAESKIAEGTKLNIKLSHTQWIMELIWFTFHDSLSLAFGVESSNSISQFAELRSALQCRLLIGFRTREIFTILSLLWRFSEFTRLTALFDTHSGLFIPNYTGKIAKCYLIKAEMLLIIPTPNIYEKTFRLLFYWMPTANSFHLCQPTLINEQNFSSAIDNSHRSTDYSDQTKHCQVEVSSVKRRTFFLRWALIKKRAFDAWKLFNFPLHHRNEFRFSRALVKQSFFKRRWIIVI